MEFITTLTIMQKFLKEIKQLSPIPTNDFMKEMQNLCDVIQIKESKNIDGAVQKLSSKCMEKRKKEEEISIKFCDMQEYSSKELTFRDNIILENCSLIIQQQQKHYELMSKERLICEHKISLNEKELRGTKEKLENTIRKDIQQFENLRFDNMQNEKNKRSEWLQTKQILSDTLLRYDTEMMEQQNELEFIKNVKETEEKELEYYKNTCASQEITYHQLMKEKEDYLEGERQKKLYEIRLRFAKRTIVKFIEQHYPAWKKRKLRASKKKSKHKFNLKPTQQKK